MIMIAMPAIPPTTPPTIAPIGVDCMVMMGVVEVEAGPTVVVLTPELELDPPSLGVMVI